MSHHCSIVTVIPSAAPRNYKEETCNLVCLFVCGFLTVCLSLCLCLFVCLSVCLSFCLSVCLSFCLSVSVGRSVSVCLSVCLCISVSAFLSLCLAVYLSLCVCIGIFLYCAELFEGELLRSLFQGLETFVDNDIKYNLALTDALCSLASFPVPLLQAYLWGSGNPSASASPSLLGTVHKVCMGPTHSPDVMYTLLVELVRLFFVCFTHALPFWFHPHPLLSPGVRPHCLPFLPAGGV